jgi:mono/diheme cytochrome c family protein
MDYPGLVFLVVVCLLSGFLAYRSSKARRRWVRFVAGVPCLILALLFGAATTLALMGYSKLNTVHPNPVPQITVALTPAMAADGERFARSCAGCHSASGNLPLSGHDFFGSDGPPIGTLWAPNLTPAQLAGWSDGEIMRAIREGVGRDGRSLMVMPASSFRHLSDEDVLSLVAYLRAQPAVEPLSPPRQITVLGAILLAVMPDFFLSAQPPLSSAVVAPLRGPTAAYGGYLTRIECQGCHAANLAGGPAGAGPPPGPNLTTIPQWVTADEFVTLLRTGRFPDGRLIGPNMPIKYLEKMSDDDIRAIYAYLEQGGVLPDNK